MKRHNKARKAIELSAVIILASAILGACAENVQKQKIPAATYMGGKASITGICKELDAAGVVCFKRLLNQSVRKSLKTYNLQQRKERKL